MATVKAIIDEFCDRVLIPREATIVGSTQPAAQQYLSLFKFIGRELLKNPVDWTQLKRLHVATTVEGEGTIQLPGDFYRLLPAMYDSTNQRPLSGPLTNQSLANRTYGFTSTGFVSGFQINGAQNYISATSPYTKTSAGVLQINPVGQNSTDEIAISYTSRNWVWPRNWATATAYTGGDLRTGVGQMYRAAASGTSGATRPSHQSGSASDGTVTWAVYSEPYDGTHDDDLVLFDDDLMIEGMRWAWYRAKKQGYEQERSDWESSVRTAIGRQNGASSVNAGYNIEQDFPFPNTQEGSWDV